MTIGALLFDLGGVIIDIDFERVFARWARDAGRPVETLRHSVGRDRKYLLYECGKIELAEYFDSLRATMGVALSDEALLAGWNEIFIGEMDGIAALLARLKGQLPLFAFSNTNAAHEAYWSVAFAPVLRSFRKVFVSSTIGLRKPDRAAFDHVVCEMGVPAKQVLFFDDTLENVEGARAAGLLAEHVRSTAEIEAALTVHGVEVN